MSFPRYERYKDAGTGWLSEVPFHWQVIPNKVFLRATNDLVGTNSSDFTLLSLTLFGVVVRDIESGKGKFPAEFDSYKAVEANDLIFCLFDLDETPRTIGLANQAGMITGAYEVLRCKSGALPSYICYFYLHVDGFKGLRPWYTGLRKVVRPDTFMSIKLALPPLDEQAAISSFLDSETSKIDELIEEQRRLVELLDEKVKSIVLSSIDSAETQQLRFGQAAQVISRPVIQREGQPYTPIGLFNRGRGLFHKDSREVDEMGDSDFFWIEGGDLIISGQFAWEGAIALAGKDETGCVVSHRYPVLRGKRDIAMTEYLFALLSTNHGDFLLNENSRGAAGRNRPLNIELLLKENVPIPSMQTQQKIAQAVHRRNELLRETPRQVYLLQERRSALISAAVTGKIDVRNYTPKESRSQTIAAAL